MSGAAKKMHVFRIVVLGKQKTVYVRAASVSDAMKIGQLVANVYNASRRGRMAVLLAGEAARVDGAEVRSQESPRATALTIEDAILWAIAGGA